MQTKNKVIIVPIPMLVFICVVICLFLFNLIPTFVQNYNTILDLCAKIQNTRDELGTLYETVSQIKSDVFFQNVELTTTFEKVKEKRTEMNWRIVQTALILLATLFGFKGVKSFINNDDN